MSDNFLSTSASLTVSDIWKKSVGYDPIRDTKTIGCDTNRDAKEGEDVNALKYTAGKCSKCGHSGHFAFQCMNMLEAFKDEILEPKPDKRANTSKPAKESHRSISHRAQRSRPSSLGLESRRARRKSRSSSKSRERRHRHHREHRRDSKRRHSKRHSRR